MLIKEKAVTISVLASISQTISADGIPKNWDQNLLLSPSNRSLASERQKHRVIIYDGIKETDVDTAMDNQFNRIEHMMFVRMKTTDETDQDADDCE